MSFRIGQGIDFHRLESGRAFILGGSRIPFDKGCAAHSDGDVLLHALCDALLGAAGLSDIGHQFPDTDQQYKNIDSMVLLEKTVQMIREKGFRMINADNTVCLEKPKISPYIEEMKKNISNVTGAGVDSISIKATTTEKLGFVGRGEGITAMSVVLLETS